MLKFMFQRDRKLGFGLGSLHKQILFALVVTSLGFFTTGCLRKLEGAEENHKNQPLPDAVADTQSKVLKTAKNLASSTTKDLLIPKYQHIFIIIEENKAYNQIIGSANAPVINQLARTYGLATNFFGEVHPSEANYVAMLGGSTFGIHDDAPYNAKASTYGSHGVDHAVKTRSLLDQLEEKGLTWKGYFEDLPSPGYRGTAYPNPIRALYASKHNGFMNFANVQNDPTKSARLVGLEQLAIDLKSGNVPNYSHIVPNQCNEMHGLPECSSLQQLIQTGDKKIGEIVQQITHASLWSSSDNNAIVITWDEDDGSTVGNQGCCGYDPKSAANFGGGHIPTIVITNHGPRGVTDNTPYNHYSLLRTVENGFGIHEYLNHAADTEKGVQSMSPLFAGK